MNSKDKLESEAFLGSKAARARDYRLKKTYGISLKDYEYLLKNQDGVCWICLRPPLPGKNLCVDHNHKTLEVRGLLCMYCNKYLVGRHTDPVLVRRIADYISQGTGFFAPPKEKKKRTRKRKRR